jgi:ketosteroid isomerase-like protein
MKSKFKLTCLLAFALMSMAACSDASKENNTVDLDKVKVEIQAMEDAFAAGELAKDAAAVAAYYSDDAVSYGRNEEPTVGKAAIQERIAKNIAKDTTGSASVYKVVDLFADGDLLVEIGSWTNTDKSGEVKKGHYMSVFQNRNGKYTCIRDMSVTSMPLKKAE